MDKKKELYLKRYTQIYRRQHGLCAIAFSKDLLEEMEELHHAHLHNTKPNRKRYPHLINSLWNLYGVSHDLHMSNPSWSPPTGRWSLIECDKREAFLSRHPEIRKGLICQ